MWWLMGFVLYAAGALVFYAALMATAQPEPCEAATTHRDADEWRKAA